MNNLSLSPSTGVGGTQRVPIQELGIKMKRMLKLIQIAERKSPSHPGRGGFRG